MSDGLGLKRKDREEEEQSVGASYTPGGAHKRVALDLEQLDMNDDREDEHRTAPAIGDTDQDMGDEYHHNDDMRSDSRPVAHSETDPTFVSFRMYCPVKEALTVVGKRGETINAIREKANVRINVSENLKNVPERIVTVRGLAENVARAFGLITRVLLDEPEDEPYLVMSKQYQLKLLIPHPMVGFIIGKQGLKFREIEEKLAAKLKAAEQPLPYLTDRILSVTGVGDAIHIAVYYVAQVILEHKECLKKGKIVFYNPANYHHTTLSLQMMNSGMGPGQINPMTMQPRHDNMYKPYPQQNYNFSAMFQPAVHPQPFMPPQPAPVQPVVPPQNPYTDEHGNTVIGEVVIQPPVLLGTNPDKFNQDIFVANTAIGLVIGKGGNNIKHIRENLGCTYVKIEPDRGQLLMLGRAPTNVRKLTLTGSLQAINTAIYLINQRILVDKERNAVH